RMHPRRDAAGDREPGEVLLDGARRDPRPAHPEEKRPGIGAGMGRQEARPGLEPAPDRRQRRPPYRYATAAATLAADHHLGFLEGQPGMGALTAGADGAGVESAEFG